MTDTKPCIICGATITRTHQGPADWEARAYCGRRCIWAARKAGSLRAAEDTKTCSLCGRQHTRPAGVSRGNWSRRRTCAECIKRRAANAGRCEVCRRALPTKRVTPAPWCSKPCRAQWQADHPTVERRSAAREDADPPVRIRSEVLPADTPRKTWVDRTPGHVAVCCGHCQRRFPRRTVRLAERLLTLHRRTCGSGL